MQGFYWLVEDVLAGCPRPGGNSVVRPGVTAQSDYSARLEADLTWLRALRISALLSLTEVALDADILAHHRFTVLHLPVDDLTAPTPQQLSQALNFIDVQLSYRRGVAVHCKVGQGRTGTILAAFLIRAGTTANKAIDRLRVLSPGAISSPAQERALHDFARRRDWVL